MEISAPSYAVDRGELLTDPFFLPSSVFLLGQGHATADGMGKSSACSPRSEMLLAVPSTISPWIAHFISLACIFTKGRHNLFSLHALLASFPIIPLTLMTI